MAEQVKTEARRSGRSFKEIVNELLRLGLTMRRQPKPLSSFTVQARPLGLRPGLDYDRVSELVEHLEGPLHR